MADSVGRRGVMSPARAMTDDDFRTLKEWGVTLLRYQMVRNWNGVNGNRDLSEYDVWLDGKLDHLDKFVLPKAVECGIDVVIDLHVPPGGRDKTYDMNMFYEKEYADHFIKIWKRIAARFRGRNGIYGYDLINEPVQTRKAIPDCDSWNLQRRAAEAVRAIDSDTPIIFSANNWDSASSFAKLKFLDMDNIIYQVHMYEPMDYTHQGLGGRSVGKSYPDSSRGLDKERLRRILAPVREFQRKHSAKIYVGEFSAIAWADGAAEYLNDCIDIFEEYGWDWSYHSFREWDGWSLEHEGHDAKHLKPSLENSRMNVVRSVLRGQGRKFRAYSMLTHDGRRLVSHMEGTNEVFSLVATNALPAYLPPVRRWKIYGVKATHTDIGLHNSQYIQRHGTVKRIEDAAKLVDAEVLEYDDPAAYRYVMEGYWFWHNYPMDRGQDAARNIIEKYVKTGKIGIGVTCAGNHTHIYSSEEVCRSIYTQKILRKRWGVDGHTMLMTDNPGVSWSVVQPYAEAGVRNLLFSPNQWNPIPSSIWPCDKSVDGYIWNPDAGGGGTRIDVSWKSPIPMVFWWESPDAKSRILTVASTQYDRGLWRFGVMVDTDKVIPRTERMTAKQLDRMSMHYPYNVWIAAVYADDEGANDRYAKFCREWNAKWATPTFATVGELDKPFDELRQFADKIPTLRGEMTSGWLQHIAATPCLMADKLAADRLLTAAEMSCAIDSAMTGAPYPAEDLRRAWWYLILNDEHSYGTSGYKGRRVFETWAQHRDWIEKASATANAILRRKEHKTRKGPVCKNESGVLENRWYRVKVNGNGEIESIFDKDIGREILDGVANRLMYTRDNHKTWELDAVGALGAEVVQTVSLAADEKKIYIDNQFRHCRDLFNDKRYYRYGYYAFPFDVPEARFFVQLNGPVIEAYKDLTGHSTDSFYCAREWVAAENSEFGVALMQLDSSLIEFGEVHPDKTAYESGKRPAKSKVFSYIFNDWLQIHVPDGESISPRFRYVITSYKGTWKENHLPRMVEGVARPYTAEAEKRVRVDAPNVILTTLKAAEDGNGFIARFRETEGRCTISKIVQNIIPTMRYCRTNVIEEGDENLAAGEITIDPFDFATVRLMDGRKIDFALPTADGYEYTGLITRPRATHGEKDGQMYLLWGAEMSPDFDYYELYRDGKFLANVKNEVHYGIPYRVARYEDLGLPTHSRHEYRLRKVWKDGRKDELGEPFFGLTRYVSEEERNGIVCEGEHGRMYVRYDGATVTSWQPGALKGREAFFMQKNAPWGKEVHGGLPICWPWFGKREGCPKHGLARYLKWRLVNRVGKDGVVLETSSTPETMKVWPYSFRLTAKIFVAGPNGLRIALTETNTGKKPYESAFGVHPYFAVADACEVALDGERLPRPWVIKDFAADGKAHELQDSAGRVAYSVMSSGNDTWCVWNPGVERTPLCETLGPDEWRRFYCLEPFMRQPITLAPGESREHVVRIAVSGL